MIFPRKSEMSSQIFTYFEIKTSVGDYSEINLKFVNSLSEELIFETLKIILKSV